jgi:FkbM family methyltransferase
MRAIRTPVRYALGKLVNRHRFNDSRLYRVYLACWHPAHAKAKKQEMEFYRKAVGGLGANLIFDVGANGGDKTVQFLSVSDKVVSIEPSPAAVEILRQRFSGNPRVTIVPKGVGRSNGTAPFHVFEAADSYNTFSAKWAKQLAAGSDRPRKIATSVLEVPVTTIDELIQEHGYPDYIKIDVEGYELEVVAGLSKNIQLVSIECNLPEFAEETLQAISILSVRDRDASFNFCTTEPPIKFESDRWLRPNEIAAIVASRQWQFMEIFCRAATSDA